MKRPSANQASLIILIGIWCLMAFPSLYPPRSNLPVLDLLPDLDNACRLLEQGEIPVLGCVSSFGGINPPGATLLFVPGLLLFPHDPFMALKIGAVLMVGVFLFGLYFLCRLLRSPWPFLLAGLLFAVSFDGSFYARSIWPRAHPAFAVWFAVFLVQWIQDRRPRALGAAVLVWMLGMFNFMEMAPLLFAIPVLFILYRPPVRLRSLVLFVVIGLVPWTPYLVYQMKTGGSDLVRNVMEREKTWDKMPVVREVLANPDLRIIGERPRGWNPDWSLSPDVPRTGSPGAGPDRSGRLIEDPRLGRVWMRNATVTMFKGEGRNFRLLDQGETWCFQRRRDGVLFMKREDGWTGQPFDYLVWNGEPVPRSALLDGLVAVSLMKNFLLPRNPLVPPLLGFSLALGLACTLMPAFATAAGKRILLQLLCGLGILSLVFAFYIGPVSLAGGISLGLSLGLILVPGMHLLGKGPHSCGEKESRLTGVVFVCLVVPLLLTVALIPAHEWYESHRRFYWLSAGLFSLLAVAFWQYFQGLRRGRMLYLLTGLVLVVTCAVSSWDSGRPRAFYLSLAADGSQHPAYDVMEFLRQDMEANGLRGASIGYDISFPLWIISHREIYGKDYKVGWDYDLVLQQRYGITNSNRLPEGVSPGDDYRIVELDRSVSPYNWPNYFDLSGYPRMEIRKVWDRYALLKKVSPED